MKLTWVEYERGGIFVFQRYWCIERRWLEHLRLIYLPRRRYKGSLCYEDQFTSYSMLCKVIILTVNASEKMSQTEFCLTEEVTAKNQHFANTRKLAVKWQRMRYYLKRGKNSQSTMKPMANHSLSRNQKLASRVKIQKKISRWEVDLALRKRQAKTELRWNVLFNEPVWPSCVLLVLWNLVEWKMWNFISSKRENENEWHIVDDCRHVPLPKSALNVNFRLCIRCMKWGWNCAILAAKFSCFGESSPGSFTKMPI